MQQEKSRIFYGRFVQKERLSAGSFGVVYICQDKVSREYVAVKVEKENSDLMSLDREIQIIEELRGVSGVPKLLWYGTEYNCQCMAMQLLGRDLAHYLKKYKRFTLKCVCNLAEQILGILEEVHKRGVIHRDIKPENILMGRGQEQNQVYLVDYGISKKYKVNGNHIPFQNRKPFIGTTRYASISAHKGQELSRKDDLESLGYVFIFFLKGNLPWQNITSSSDKEKTKMVGKLKMDLEPKELCKGLPHELQRYMDYVQTLKFNANPDYKYLLQLFQKIASQNMFQLDRKFDWLEGTSTTKSSDTGKEQFKEEFSEHMASDYLKLPDQKHSPHSERRQSHHRQIESQLGSQQSSVMLNYVPSLIINQPQSRFLTKEKKTINSRQSSFSRESSIQRKQQPSLKLQQQSYDVDAFYKGQYFQDLEKRDEQKQKQEKAKRKVSCKDDTQFDMDDMEEDSLAAKVKMVSHIPVHFKEGLSKD